MSKIVAIGGGENGYTDEDGVKHPYEVKAIDKAIVELTGKKNPKLLFIPTASYDSESYYDVISKNFAKLGCTTDVLYLSKTTDTKTIKDKILSSDAIYVGGGNTLRMMTIWRRLGVDKLLKQAYKKDIVLSGLSAGSICWFICGNSDSRQYTNGSDQLIKVTGLGYIDALHCPHYDAEPHRQKDLKRMMKTTPKLVAIALDNCAALEVVDDKYRIVTSKPTAKARKCYWQKSKYIIEEIEIKKEYSDLKGLLTK